MRWTVLFVVFTFLTSHCPLLGQAASTTVRPDSLLSLARKQAALKEYAASIRSYHSYLGEFGTDNDVRNELARTLAWSGQFDSALTQYDLIRRVDPLNFDALYGRCQTLGWRGDLKEAVAESDTLVSRYRGNVDALLLSAQLHARAGDFRRSLELNTMVNREDPENVPALLGMCAALEALGRPDEAREKVGKFREHNSRNGEVEALYQRLSPRPLNQVFVRFQNESFDVQGRSDFRTVEAQGYRALRSDLTVFLQFDSYRRFDQDDQAIGVGAYYSPGSGQSLYGYVLVSPDPRVTSTVDASLEYEHTLTMASSAFLDYRLLSFKSETAHILSPGFMWRPIPVIELRPRVYIDRTVIGKTTSTAFVLRTSYEGWDTIEPYLFYSIGNEAYRGVTLDNVESTQSWSITGGAKIMATRQIVVRVNYQYLIRISSFKEMSFDLGMGFLW